MPQHVPVEMQQTVFNHTVWNNEGFFLNECNLLIECECK